MQVISCNCRHLNCGTLCCSGAPSSFGTCVEYSLSGFTELETVRFMNNVQRSVVCTRKLSFAGLHRHGASFRLGVCCLTGCNHSPLWKLQWLSGIVELIQETFLHIMLCHWLAPQHRPVMMASSLDNVNGYFTPTLVSAALQGFCESTLVCAIYVGCEGKAKKKA